MPTPVTFQVEDYFQEFANDSAMAEAARFKTIPAGRYKGQVTKYEGRYFEEKESKKGGKYWSVVFSDSLEVKPEWRKGVQYTAELSNGEDKRLTTVRIEASWEDKRNAATGGLDQLFSRWDQLTRAVFPNYKAGKDAPKTLGELSGVLTQFPVAVTITESFKVPAIDGSTKWTTAVNDEQAKEYRAAGYEVKNFVQGIGKY